MNKAKEKQDSETLQMLLSINLNLLLSEDRNVPISSKHIKCQLTVSLYKQSNIIIFIVGSEEHF